MVSFFFLRVKTDVYFCLYSTPANNQEKCRGRRTWTTDSPLFDNFEPLWYIIAKISARILLALQSNKIPIRVARGTSPMTARQPPREKGAKACTIGLYQSRDWYFCAYFFWEFREMRCIFVIRWIICSKNALGLLQIGPRGVWGLSRWEALDYVDSWVAKGAGGGASKGRCSATQCYWCRDSSSWPGI